MRKTWSATIPAFVLLLTAAVPALAAAPVNEAEATRIADATVAAWLSMDAARIKALYAPSIKGFDYAVGPLSTDRATWDRAQDAFAAAKLDHADRQARAIQLLGPDSFVVSGVWSLTSSAHPGPAAAIRCTDVYARDAAGKWQIVTEHCSAMPSGS